MGSGNTGTIGGKGGKGSKFGAYAYKVQSTVKAAMSRDAKLRMAIFSGTMRIWADNTGRITRASFSGEDGGLDQALESAMTGLTLSEPPPADMPMPIVMRTSARKPANMASR
jgi:hypothetical protein